MAITYTWIIHQLDCYPEHDNYTEVVFQVHWRRQATDGTHTADIYGSEFVTLDSDAPFTPFNELTKDQVVQWLIDKLGFETVAKYDSQLAKAIDLQINPPNINLPPPWA